MPQPADRRQPQARIAWRRGERARAVALLRTQVAAEMRTVLADLG